MKKDTRGRHALEIVHFLGYCDNDIMIRESIVTMMNMDEARAIVLGTLSHSTGHLLTL